MGIAQGKFVNPHLRQPAGQRIKGTQGIDQRRAQTGFRKGRCGWRHGRRLRQLGHTQQIGTVHAHKGHAQRGWQGLPVPAGAACGQAQPQAIGIVQLDTKRKCKGQGAGKMGDTRTDGWGSLALRHSPVWRRGLHGRIDFICQPRLYTLAAQGRQPASQNASQSQNAHEQTQTQRLARTAQPTEF